MHEATDQSVFLHALGDEASRLRPEVWQYAMGTGTGVGVGEGVFDVAGGRFRALGALARPLVGPDLLMTAYEHDVPFRIVNRPVHGVRGMELHAERRIRFRSGTFRFVDVLRPGPEPGTLQNLLGRKRRVELLLRCAVTRDGSLQLTSERAWLRLGRTRLRLPALLSVRASLVNGYDPEHRRHLVRATVRSPLLGTVVEYRGWFLVRNEPGPKP